MTMPQALAAAAAAALLAIAQPAAANDRYKTDLGEQSAPQVAVEAAIGQADEAEVVLVTKRKRRYVVPQYVPEPGQVYYYDNSGSLKDEPGAYPPDYSGDYPEIYDEAAVPPPAGGSTGQCLASWQIQRNLVRQGWRDFSGPQKGVDVVGLTARRPNGLTYRLKLDRCTGVIVAAHLLDQVDRRRTYTYSAPTSVPGY